MEEITVHFIWEITYQEANVPKHFDTWEWELARKFSDRVQVTSIVFYATGFSQPKERVAYQKNRIYEETLTKDELASVDEEWIQGRIKKVKQIYSKSD